MSPSSWTSPHLPPNPTPLGCYRAPIWVPWVIQQIPIGYLFYMWYCKFSCYSFHTFHSFPSPFPPCPYVCSLCLFLHCCPANKFISTIFLDSIYICISIRFIFLFLTYFTLYKGSSFVHLIRTDSDAFLFMAE